MSISVETLQDRSLVYFVKGLVPTTVNVVDSFPINYTGQNPALVLPTISVDANDIRGLPFELGNYVDLPERFWSIDIFAKTKTQRDELAYLMYNSFQTTIPVYDYNFGFPPTVVPQIGYMSLSNIVVKSLKVMNDLVEDLYWRTTITFVTKYSMI